MSSFRFETFFCLVREWICVFFFRLLVIVDPSLEKRANRRRIGWASVLIAFVPILPFDWSDSILQTEGIDDLIGFVSTMPGFQIVMHWYSYQWSFFLQQCTKGSYIVWISVNHIHLALTFQIWQVQVNSWERGSPRALSHQLELIWPDIRLERNE